MIPLIITLGIAQYIPYFYGIHKGDVKPTVAGWVVCALSTLIIIMSVLNGGSYSALVAAGSSLICQLGVIAYSLLYKNSIDPTSIDVICIFSSIVGVILWFHFKNPLIALYINVVIDTVGILLISKKLYNHPFTESKLTWGIGTINSVLICFLFVDGTILSSLFPIYLLASNLIIFIQSQIDVKDILIKGLKKTTLFGDSH